MEPLATHSDCIVTSIRIRYLFLSPMEVLLGVNRNLDKSKSLKDPIKRNKLTLDQNYSQEQARPSLCQE